MKAASGLKPGGLNGFFVVLTCGVPPLAPSQLFLEIGLCNERFNQLRGMLHTNRDFRLMWTGQLISLVGDNFNSIATIGPSGMALFIEPIGEKFDQEKWTNLLIRAGYKVNVVERFFEMEPSRGETEYHALTIGTRRAS